MPPSPPTSAARKDQRVAIFINLVVPGGGQFYLGQRLWGAALALAFLSCFGAMITLFLVGLKRYYDVIVGGEILEGDSIERLQHALPIAWFLILLGLGILCYILAFATMPRPRPPSPDVTGTRTT